MTTESVRGRKMLGCEFFSPERTLLREKDKKAKAGLLK